MGANERVGVVGDDEMPTRLAWPSVSGRGGMASCLRVVLDDDPILPYVDAVLGGGRHDHKAGDERSEGSEEDHAPLMGLIRLSPVSHNKGPGLAYCSFGQSTSRIL